MATKADKAAKAAEKRAHALALIARTQDARKRSGLTQEQMGEALIMDQGIYKQYETRTPLPDIYHKRFCIIARVTPDWFVFGKGAEHLKEPIRQARKRRKIRKARAS